MKLGLSLWDKCRLIQIHDKLVTRLKIQKLDRLFLKFKVLGGYWGKSWLRTGPPDRRSKGYYGGDGLGFVIAILLILLSLGKL
ncbi:MAG: hypothetical protein ACXU9A_23305 [Xanthobacteraceae bacterium]